jgi:16S rRNA processing protein RimM
MRKEELLAIGAVVRPHGVQGKIRVRYEGDDPHHFLTLQDIWLGSDPDRVRHYEVCTIQPQGRQFILSLAGMDLPKAEAAAGDKVWVPRAYLPPLEEGEYYWQDLIGLEVRTELGEVLGFVEALFETGSNDVLVCRSGEAEILLPFIEAVIVRVDLQQGRIWVRLPEGLL